MRLVCHETGGQRNVRSFFNSDIDCVRIDDFSGCDHLAKSEEDIEYFIFGKNQFIEKMNFEKSITPYLLVFNDDILSDVEPIYLDNSFKEIYEGIRNRPFGEYITDYLEAVIAYYGTLLDINILRKNMYHLYRIEEQVKRYFDSGEFTLGVSDETLEKMMVLKTNFATNNDDTLAELKGIINYFKGVITHDE